MEKWLNYLNMSIEQVGDVKKRNLNIFKEKQLLKNFQRGVYLKKNIKKKANEKISFKNVSFHFPLSKGQLSANNYSRFSDFKANKPIDYGNKLLIKDLRIKNSRGKTVEIRNKVKIGRAHV